MYLTVNKFLKLWKRDTPRPGIYISRASLNPCSVAQLNGIPAFNWLILKSRFAKESTFKYPTRNQLLLSEQIWRGLPPKIWNRNLPSLWSIPFQLNKSTEELSFLTKFQQVISTIQVKAFFWNMEEYLLCRLGGIMQGFPKFDYWTKSAILIGITCIKEMITSPRSYNPDC